MKSSLVFSQRLCLLILCLIPFALLSGCGTKHPVQPDTEWRTFSGRMVGVPRGMHGFWGIQTREHGRIHPLKPVEEPFQQKRLSVHGELLLRPDMGSIRSWGKVAEIRNLEVRE